MFLQGQIVTAKQEFTTSWADFGGEISTDEVTAIGGWFELDANSATDMRVRLLAKNPYSASLEYSIPIKTTSSSKVSLAANYAEWSSDTDQNMLVSWDLDRIVPKVQFQISAGDKGSTGEVDSAIYTMHKGR